MKKAEKPLFVQNLSEELKSASSIVLIDFTGLSVKAQQELKKNLSQIGAKLIITKNTLFKLAGSQAKLSKETLTDEVLTGPTALVITEGDPIAPLQILAKFSGTHEIPQFKVGVIEGSFYDKMSLTTLSKLPSKEILLSQVASAIASPMYGIISVTQSNLQKLVYVLSKGGGN